MFLCDAHSASHATAHGTFPVIVGLAGARIVCAGSLGV